MCRIWGDFRCGYGRNIGLVIKIHNTHEIEFLDYDISFKGIYPKCKEKNYG